MVIVEVFIFFVILRWLEQTNRVSLLKSLSRQNKLEGAKASRDLNIPKEICDSRKQKICES